MSLPHSQKPIAIVGLGCRLPGSSNLDEYWRLIESGGSAIGELPASRLNQHLYFDPNVCERPRTITRLGGIVSPYIGLRSKHKLTDGDIAAADPAHLELVSVTEDAIAYAGWTDDAFRNKKTGVYVGHTRGTGRTGEYVYRSLIPETVKWLEELPTFSSLPSSDRARIMASIVESTQREYAGCDPKSPEKLEAFQGSYLISRAFDLDGPAVSLNAACASSLIALSYASQALRLGTIDVAVVGGGSFVEFDSLVLFSRAGSVSKTGSRPFDAGADGLVAAEGYVILLLKTLEKALEDGDSIAAVIRGAGYSSDGKGKSLWAPRKEGQILAIQRAFGDALSKKRVQYIEAHATSTAVGDAIEMAALSEAFQDSLQNGQSPIPIGSVKANIGHTLETAGLAGLVKAVLAIKNKTIPPVSYIGELNPKVDWAKAPFLVPPQKYHWEVSDSSLPRRVGVNAFGIGGLNAHIVIDEFLPSYAKDYFRPDAELCSLQANNRSTEVMGGATSPSASLTKEPIAIIGLGVISPAGCDAASFWDSTSKGQTWLSEPGTDRFNWDNSINKESKTQELRILGGFLRGYKYDWRKHKVPPKQVDAADPLQFMLLDAVDQALRHTGISEGHIPRDRTGVVIGSIFGGEFGNQLQMGLRLPEFSAKLQAHLLSVGYTPSQIDETIDAYQKLLLTRMPALIDETGSFTSSTLASRITKSFDVMGGGSAIDSGGISGIAALELCANALNAGDADMMICAAGQRSCGQIVFDQLLNTKFLNTTGKYVVGNSDASGVIPGEGAAVVVLKRLSDAQRDGNKIYSVIHSISTIRSEKLGSAFAKVDQNLASALKTTACDGVQYIELCANGTKFDSAEFDSLGNVFGKASSPTIACSLKEQIGDSLGAASLMAIVRASLSLANATIPASVQQTSRDQHLNLSMPAVSKEMGNGDPKHPSCVVVHAACENLVAGVLLTNLAALEPRKSASTNIFVGGHQEHIPQVLFRFGGDTISELLASLQSVLNQGSYAAEEARRSADDWQRFRYRLNIVAFDKKTFLTKLELAIHALDQNRPISSLQNQGIFFAKKGSSLGAEMAFVYSGQGSQYPGMLSSFLKDERDCNSEIANLEEAVRSMGLGTFTELVQDDAKQLGNDLLRTQLGILGCEILLTEKLKKMGLVPHRVAGHSFGEYGAMYGAGCWNMETALKAAVMRSDSVCKAEVIPGRLLCAFCDEKTAGFACNNANGQAFVANCNTASQTVIGGTEQGLILVRDFLEKNRIRSVNLNVPFAFHTPLMKSASQLMRDQVEYLDIQPSTRQLLSSVSESYVNNKHSLRENLTEQFVKPVRWTRMLEMLQSENVRFFVEIGPGQILTGLNRQVLKDHEDCICVATDDSKSSCHKQLHYLTAAFEMFEHLSYSGQVKRNSESKDNPINFKPAKTKTHSLETESTQEKVMIDQSRTMDSSLFHAFKLIATKPVTSSLSSPRRNLLPMAERLLGQEHQDLLQSLSAKYQVTPESLLRWNVELVESRSAGQSHYVSFPCDKEMGFAFHGFHDRAVKTTANSRADYAFSTYQSEGYLRHVVAGTAGQLGGLLGMNESGISMSSVAIGSERTNPSGGLLQSIVTLMVLREADGLEESICVLRQLARNGNWGVLLLDGKSKKASYIEYDHDRFDIHPLTDSFCVPTSGIGTKFRGSERTKLDHSDRISNLLKELNGSSGEISAVWNKISTKAILDSKQNSDIQDASVSNRLAPRGVLMSPSSFRMLYAPHSNGLTNSIDKPNELDFTNFLSGPSQIDTQKANRIEPAKPQALDHSKVPKPLPEPLPKQTTHVASQNVSNPFIISPKELATAGNSVAGAPPLGDTNLICTRLALRLVESRLPADNQTIDLLQGKKAVILGRNQVSSLLIKSLKSRGAEAHILDVSGEPDTILSRWSEHIAQCGQPDHLFVMTEWDSSLAESSIIESSQWRSKVLGPYLVCQQWFSAFPDTPREKPVLFVVATRMSGDLGLSGISPYHFGGALSGLSKAMFLERSVTVGPDLRTHAIDFHENATPDTLVESILAEIEQPEREAEVSYQNGQRHVLRLVQSPLSLPEETNKTSSTSGCWVVTGGARGVTAEIAKRLGTISSGTIHLVGSSPLPAIPQAWLNLDSVQTRELRSTIVRKAIEEKKTPADVWTATEKAIEIAKNLQTMKEQGIRIEYHACDISDRGNVTRLMTEIRKCGEPIVGVVHGAGYEKASRFSGKKLPLVLRTLESKVLGAINLMHATDEDPIRHFVAFTSISGRYGAIGQTDYGTANEWLTKVVARYQNNRPNVHAVAMDWHSWDEVGMAARPETKHSKLLATMRFMPVHEGVDHFMKEIAHRSGENEVVITDWQYHKMFFADPVKPCPVEEPGCDLSSSQNPTDLGTEFTCVEYEPVVAPWECKPASTSELGEIVVIGSHPVAHSLITFLATQGVSFRWMSMAEAMSCDSSIQSSLRTDNSTIFLCHDIEPESLLSRGWNNHQKAIRNAGAFAGLVKRLREGQKGNARTRVVIAASLNTSQNESKRPQNPGSSLLLESLASLKDSSLDVSEVDLCSSVSPGQRANHLWQEALHADGKKLSSFTSVGRFQLQKASRAKQWMVKQLPADISRRSHADTCLLIQGSTLVVSVDQVKQLIELAGYTTQSLVMSREELDTPAGLCDLQRRISSIRRECNDTIRSVCLLLDSSLSASSQIQQLASLIELTRADQLRSFFVVSDTKVESTSPVYAWLKWYQSDRSDVLIQLVEKSNSKDSKIEKLSFLPKVLHSDGIQSSVEILVDPVQDPFLAQHLFRGRPLLPIVAITEMMLQAAHVSEVVLPNQSFSLNDVAVTNGLKFLDDQPKQLRVLFEKKQDEIKVELVHSFFDSRGKLMDDKRVIAQGRLCAVATPTASYRPQDVSAAYWYPVEYPGPEMVIYHGPAFRCLREVHYVENGLVAKLVAQPDSALGGNRWGTWISPMGVIDSSLFACGVLAWIRDPSLAAIPLGYESIMVHGQCKDGEELFAGIQLKSIDKSQAIFDIEITNRTGESIVSLLGFHTTLVSHNLS